MNTSASSDNSILKGVMAIVAGAAVLFAAWLTHVVVCIKAANYLFLIAGGLFFPIGIIHGFGVWIGAW